MGPPPEFTGKNMSEYAWRVRISLMPRYGLMIFEGMLDILGNTSLVMDDSAPICRVH